MALSRPVSVSPLPGEPVRSVSEFTQEVKAALEAGVRSGWVRGEVSNLRRQASGHVYFSLKDAGSQVSAVMFRGDVLRQTLELSEGRQVVAWGEISVYEPRGSYQLVVRSVVEDGIGRLQREFEALKARLTEEGLFEASRKVPLPTLPFTVGFLTSPTGAAVQDFCRILIRRGWRGRLVVIPCKVQGEGAAAELAQALTEAGSSGNYDLLVIGRGGGSIEDLWAFNEEILVRAVAACPVPIVSAVGHEIDFTLCDFAADVRAETPSAAAELISSSFVAALEKLVRLRRAWLTQAAQQTEARRLRVSHLASRLRLLSPSAKIERAYLRLDDAVNRLHAVVARGLQRRRERWVRAATRFSGAHPARRVEFDSHRLLALWKRLQAASPESILQRGYVIVRGEGEQPVLRAGDVTPAAAYSLQFADGRVRVHAQP